MSAKTKTPAQAPATKGGVNSTSEILVLTKDQTLALERAFTVSSREKVARVRLMMDYAHFTVPQIVVAMHANADKNGYDLVVDSAAQSTMNRALAIAKAWVISKAGDVVPAGNHDSVLLLLAQIADVTPGNLAKYLVPEKKRTVSKGQQWGTVTVYPSPKAKVEDQFDPYDVEIEFGAGERAIAAIVGEYLDERIVGDGMDALLWLTDYRNAVVYANNEFRRTRTAHNKRAADSRVGDGDGTDKQSKKSKKRGARNQGGTSKKTQGSEREPADEPGARKKSKGSKGGQPASKPKTPDEITAALTTHDLIVVLTKRVATYTVALSNADTKAWDDMTGHYDKRFRKIPVGKTSMDVTKRGTVKRDKNRTAQPVGGEVKVETARTLALVPTVSEGALVPTFASKAAAALLAEQKAGRITAKKRKATVQRIWEGRMNEDQFRSFLAKNQGRELVAAG